MGAVAPTSVSRRLAHPRDHAASASVSMLLSFAAFIVFEQTPCGRSYLTEKCALRTLAALTSVNRFLSAPQVNTSEAWYSQLPRAHDHEREPMCLLVEPGVSKPRLVQLI